MATTDLDVTSIVSSTGWTGATVANLSTSNDVRATDGDAGEIIEAQLADVPVDFSTMNTVTLKIEGRVTTTGGRPRQFQLDLLDSASNVLQTFTTGNLTTSDVIYTSSAFSRSDSQTVINGWKIRVTVTEGGGMPSTEKNQIDRVWVTLDYNVAQQFVITAEGASFSLGAQDVDLDRPRIISAESAAYVIAGQNVNLQVARYFAAESAPFVLDAKEATLIETFPLAVESAQFLLEGQTVIPRPAYHPTEAVWGRFAWGEVSWNEVAVGAAEAHIDIIAQPVDMIVAESTGVSVEADSAAFTIGAQNVNLSVGLSLGAESAPILMDAKNVNLTVDLLFPAEAAAYALGAQPAGLLAARTLAAQPAAYALSGQAAGVVAARALGAVGAAYALQGQVANLLTGREISAESAPFLLDGQDVLFVITTSIFAESAPFLLDGQDTGLLADYQLQAESYSILLDGKQVDLLYQQEKKVDAESAAFLLGAQDVNTIVGNYIAAESAALIYVPRWVEMQPSYLVNHIEADIGDTTHWAHSNATVTSVANDFWEVEAA